MSKRLLAAIMFSDIVGYTAMMQKSEEETLDKVERYKQVHKEKVQEFEGRILKYFGDGSLTIFDSVYNAVQCAIQIQQSLQQSPKVPIRIGIHTGEVIFSEEDVYGDSINITSRIQSLGVEGSVLFSQDVYEKIKNHADLKVEYLGKQSLKNVMLPLDIYALSNSSVSVPRFEKVQDVYRLGEKSLVGRLKYIFVFARKQYVRYLAFILMISLSVIIIYRQFDYQNNKNQIVKNDLPLLIDQIKTVSADFEAKENWSILNRAKAMKNYVSENPEFEKLWNDISFDLTINTDPEGAAVYAKPYSRPDEEWEYIGVTPIKEFRFPKGLSRIMLRKDGYLVQEDFLQWGSLEKQDTIEYRLFKEGQIPIGMVYVSVESPDFGQGSVRELSAIKLDDYLIDRYEVTNLDYKDFVDEDGYKNPVYWRYPFVKEGDTLTWEEAMKEFRDKTNWPGPSNWELSEYPNGAANLPVSGVSWYEAAAYAEFRNKSLPTIYHWINIADFWYTAEIIKHGNYLSNTLKEVMETKDMTRFGTYNLAGNLSEWLFNSNRDNKYHLGGNFKEPSYWYNQALSSSPWTRSEILGFRCIQYLGDSINQELTKSFDRLGFNRNFDNEKPVSTEVLNAYIKQFKLEKIKIEPVIESQVKEDFWTIQQISISVPYVDLPLRIHLYLPVNVDTPFQTVVYFPHDGTYSRNYTVKDDVAGQGVDFFAKNGRAFVIPEFYLMFGRAKKYPSNYQERKQSFTYQMMDLQMVVNYLETRKDIDVTKLAYFGISMGSEHSPIALNVEERFKVAILSTFGITSNGKYPELDRFNYLPRIKIPTLMLGGKYDQYFLYNETQVPFYKLLGTPQEHKKMLTYETTHYVPRNDLINESNAWLDKYFGPVSFKK